MKENQFMSIPSFALFIAYDIFYIEDNKYYFVEAGRKRTLLNEDEYNARIQANQNQNISYMLLYDYMFALKRDKWEAQPQSIDIDELEAYYELSILSEEDLVKYRYLYSEYKNK